MNDKKRVEDSKVSTSVEFVKAIYDEFKGRGHTPEAALSLTKIAVLDLRLYDIMRSIDTVVSILENQL